MAGQSFSGKDSRRVMTEHRAGEGHDAGGRNPDGKPPPVSAEIRAGCPVI